MLKINDIRNQIIQKYRDQDFVTDKTGVKTVEIIGQSFLVDEDWIIRKPNYDYIKREIEWYESQSLYVEDIPGDTPQIWKEVSSNHGRINSNYGYLIFSEKNGNQYTKVLSELLSNPNSRRATMIYNRPSMHDDYREDMMNDFICTYANTFMIRDGKLHSHYILRSNDAVFGANNDFAWARYVQNKLSKDLRVEVGDLIWTASSLHVYERHFKFIEELMNQQANTSN